MKKRRKVMKKSNSKNSNCPRLYAKKRSKKMLIPDVSKIRTCEIVNYFLEKVNVSFNSKT